MKPLTQDETDKIIRTTLRAFNATFGELRPLEGDGDCPQDLAADGISRAIRGMQE